MSVWLEVARRVFNETCSVYEVCCAAPKPSTDTVLLQVDTLMLRRCDVRGCKEQTETERLRAGLKLRTCLHWKPTATRGGAANPQHPGPHLKRCM